MKTSLRRVRAIAEPVAKSVDLGPKRLRGKKTKKKTSAAALSRCTFHQGPTRNIYVVFNTDVQILLGMLKTSKCSQSLFNVFAREEKRYN